MDFGPKNSTFGPKKAHFGQSGPKNGPPSGQTATYRKTKGIQSCLMIWGTYDPIESGPSGPKKGHFGQSVPKNGPPSGQTATYRKTEGIQSYLRIWGTCDQSGPVRLTQKNGGFIGVA